MKARRHLALALAPLVLVACDDFGSFSGGDGGVPLDAAVSADLAPFPVDVSSPPDVASAIDLASPGDLAVIEDLAVRIDLATPPDATVLPDLVMPVVPDLTVRDFALPPDLVTVPDLVVKGPLQLSLGAATAYTVGAFPTNMVAATLNRDQAPDLVVACSADASVQTLLNANNGSGAFNPPVRRATAANPVAVTAADFNLDGDVDVVVTHESGPLSFLPGTNGALGAPAGIALALAMGTTLSGVTAGDWNGDKKPDLALVQVPAMGSGSVVPLAGQGDGTFKASAPLVVGKAPGRMITLAADRDAFPDALACNFNDPSVSTLLGGMNGLSQGKTTQIQQLPLAAAAGDLDGDGVVDVAIAGTGGAITVLVGKGDGSYNAGQPLPVVSTNGVAIADFDLDGRLDVAASSSAANILVFPGNGNGTFKPAQPFAAMGARFLAVADFNLDGKPDLAATAISNNNMTHQVLVLLNTSK